MDRRLRRLEREALFDPESKIRYSKELKRLGSRLAHCITYGCRPDKWTVSWRGPKTLCVRFCKSCQAIIQWCEPTIRDIETAPMNYRETWYPEEIMEL